MYLGGVLVRADEADHQTCKELGVICPLCSEAVFYRKGFVRKVNKDGEVREEVVPPAFIHYKAQGDLPQSCENRIRTSEGKKILASIEATARNQRLELYNKHLWEMLARDRNFDSETLDRVRDLVGDRFLRSIGKEVKAYWRKETEDVRQGISQALASLEKDTVGQVREDSPHLPIDRVAAKLNYFQYRCDRRLHLQVCQELVSFMATKSANYFWTKLIICAVGYTAFAPSQMGKKIEQSCTREKIVVSCGGLIIGTCWLEQISYQLKLKAKHA